MSNRSKSEQKPTAANIDLPIFIPTSKGETKLEVGKARLRAGTLVVEFRDTGAAVALQKMIERGVLLGMSMILLQPDALNQKYQDIVEQEAVDREEKDTVSNEEL